MNNLQNTSSKNVAKERLKNMLMKDRTDVSSDELRQLKDEIIYLAEEYFSVKRHGCDIYLTDAKKYGGSISETLIVCVLPVQNR